MLYIGHARPDIYAETATLLEPMDDINLRPASGAPRPPTPRSFPTCSPIIATGRAFYDDGLIRLGHPRPQQAAPDLCTARHRAGHDPACDGCRMGPRPSARKSSRGTPGYRAAAPRLGARWATYEGHICTWHHGLASAVSCRSSGLSILFYLATMPSALLGSALW